MHAKLFQTFNLPLQIFLDENSDFQNLKANTIRTNQFSGPNETSNSCFNIWLFLANKMLIFIAENYVFGSQNCFNLRSNSYQRFSIIWFYFYLTTSKIGNQTIFRMKYFGISFIPIFVLHLVFLSTHTHKHTHTHTQTLSLSRSISYRMNSQVQKSHKWNILLDNFMRLRRQFIYVKSFENQIVYCFEKFSLKIYIFDFVFILSVFWFLSPYLFVSLRSRFSFLKTIMPGECYATM